ncbi:MAG: DUF3501 family protein [Alphaproteobacteria bacterium]
MTAKRRITRDDILPMNEYAAVRGERRARLMKIKQDRRVGVGPFAIFHFETYDTMWMQVHEMLYIEGGGEEQIGGELEAYNPLIPRGSELIATLMLEIDDRDRRERLLGQLGGIERSASMSFAGQTIKAAPILDDVERTTPEGRTSSVHFLRFSFTREQIAKFREPGTEVVLAIAHPNYGHMAVVPDAVRAALAEDFD